MSAVLAVQMNGFGTRFVSPVFKTTAVPPGFDDGEVVVFGESETRRRRRRDDEVVDGALVIAKTGGSYAPPAPSV